MVVYLSGKVEVSVNFCLLSVFLQFHDCSLDVSILFLVDFQSLFLHTLSSESPITFGRFLHSVHIPGVATANLDLIEERSSFLVLKLVDGEYLFPLHIVDA